MSQLNRNIPHLVDELIDVWESGQTTGVRLAARERLVAKLDAIAKPTLFLQAWFVTECERRQALAANAPPADLRIRTDIESTMRDLLFDLMAREHLRQGIESATEQALEVARANAPTIGTV